MKVLSIFPQSDHFYFLLIFLFLWRQYLHWAARFAPISDLISFTLPRFRITYPGAIFLLNASTFTQRRRSYLKRPGQYRVLFFDFDERSGPEAPRCDNPISSPLFADETLIGAD